MSEDQQGNLNSLWENPAFVFYMPNKYIGLYIPVGGCKYVISGPYTAPKYISYGLSSVLKKSMNPLPTFENQGISHKSLWCG